MLIPIVPPFAGSIPYVFSNALVLSGTQRTLSYGGRTLITKIPASLLLSSGTRIRLTLLSGGIACTLNNVTISNAATSGNAWNSASTPTAVTKDGLAAWSLSGPAGSSVVSDEISFNVTGANALIVAINADNTANATRYMNAISSPNTGVIAYDKASVQEADDASRGSGYAASGASAWLISKLEVA